MTTSKKELEKQVEALQRRVADLQQQAARLLQCLTVRHVEPFGVPYHPAPMPISPLGGPHFYPVIYTCGTSYKDGILS